MMQTEAKPYSLVARTLPAFSIFSAITYFVVMGFGIATFIYYPQVGEWHLARQKDIGPPMFFYGWLVDAAVAGSIGAGMAAILPARASSGLVRAYSWLSWIVPVGLTIAVLYFLKSYFGL